MSIDEDDEPEVLYQRIELDEQALLATLRTCDISSETGNTANMSVTDILKRMSDVKEQERMRLESLKPPPKYVPPGGWKRTEKPTQKAESKPYHKVDHSIAQFHYSVPKWDGSFNMDPELAKTIHRTPVSDPSGKKIFSLQRDMAKGVAPWKPGPQDRDFPESINVGHADHVIHHLTTVAHNIEVEYNQIPTTNERCRTYKASLGSDLYRIQNCRSWSAGYATPFSAESGEVSYPRFSATVRPSPRLGPAALLSSPARAVRMHRSF